MRRLGNSRGPSTKYKLNNGKERLESQNKSKKMKELKMAMAMLEQSLIESNDRAMKERSDRIYYQEKVQRLLKLKAIR